MIQRPNKLWLPRTGQVTSIATGDDGYFQAGNPRKTRFYDNLNGTISDRATGLMWVKQPELIIPGATGIQTTNQIQCIRGTWKVPPDDGLGAYVAGDLVVGDGAPDALFYVCILGHTAHADYEPPNVTYWRETVWANITSDAVESWTKGTTTVLTMTAHAFAVGQLVTITGVLYNTSVASAVNGNRVITAIATNTITVAVNTASEGTPVASAGSVLGANPAKMTWANAVAKSLGTKYSGGLLNYAGFTDWRLPNLFSLASLVDYQYTSSSVPAIDRVAFPNTHLLDLNIGYWASTTYATLTTYAFRVTFRSASGDPNISTSAKTGEKYLRPVRGGRINANW
jgi:hypothetical protein